jgi:hypothetical protein
VFPRHPRRNDVVVNDGIAYRWDGHKWVRHSLNRRAQGQFVVASRPPENPPLGTLWYQPREEKLAVWIGRDWVPVGGRGEFLPTKGGGTIHGDLKVTGETLVNIFNIRPGWPEQDERDRQHEHERDEERR